MIKVHNMILTLPSSTAQSCLPHNQLKMDSNIEHMAGGRMVLQHPPGRPPSRACNPQHLSLVTQEDIDNRINLAMLYGGPVLNDTPNRSRGKPRNGSDNGHRSSLTVPVAVTRPQGIPVIVADNRRNSHLCSQEATFLNLVPVTVQSCRPAGPTVRRTSSSSSSSSGDGDVSLPRSPVAQLSLVLENAFEPEENVLPVPPRSTINCYENIPIPGIIPIAKAHHTSSKKDPISAYSKMSQLDSNRDNEVTRTSLERLNASGFYYDKISAQEAKDKLRNVQVGTFLVRLSSHSSHLFTLSVKTNRGTTSIRIANQNGCFRLDADPNSAPKMPSFGCIIALIEHYVVQSNSDARNKCVFLESNGRRDTPVILTRPLKERPQSLRHLCRRNLHYNFPQDALSTHLDTSPVSCSLQLRQYIKNYPYAL